MSDNEFTMMAAAAIAAATTTATAADTSPSVRPSVHTLATEQTIPDAHAHHRSNDVSSKCTRLSKMSSVQMDRPLKVGQSNKKLLYKKHKHDDNRHFKFSKKRPQSSFNSNGKFFSTYKRRKKEGVIIPPTKFLLGGNICDPLNLNSMQDEEINRAMNAVTPKSSPLPTPKYKKEAIDIVIPVKHWDPLNLGNCNDNEECENQLVSPTKKTCKRRNRRKKKVVSSCEKNEVKKTMENDETVVEIEVSNVPVESPMDKCSDERINDPKDENMQTETILKESKTESPQKDKNKLRLKGLDEIKDKRLRKIDIKDKIVSPVIPQPGAWKSRPQHRPNQDKKKKVQVVRNFRLKDARYQYGNYNRYYGYRNPHREIDPRLKVFSQRKELFLHKDILDIGCNIGHITLSIARDFGAKSVTGIDIDRILINIARKNVKHYVNCVQSPASNEDNDKRDSSDVNFFPMSMPISYGPVEVPGFLKNKQNKGFPYNVTFVQGNYVLENDTLLNTEQSEQFDMILCLSVTKWIHLNFGDAGLKQAFKRMHAQLRPGGVLVLEPQGWASYIKKKNLTERICKNYHDIQFRPHKFTQYLLSSEVGFCKCEVLSAPPYISKGLKGFQRPINLFTKIGGPNEQQTKNANNASSSRQERMTRRNEEEIRDRERIKYEEDLFPKGNRDQMSEISQQNQYEQLANIYAPSATPCYDTPSHNSDS